MQENKKVIPFPVKKEEVEVVKTVVVTKKRKLRPWVKVFMGAVLSSIMTADVIFNAETTTYVEVEVETGDNVCTILAEYNPSKSCNELIGEVYNSNSMFIGKATTTNKVYIGDVLTIPVVEKRFVK